MNDVTVLVTGGTGFLAGHCIAQLVRDGYRVRFTSQSQQGSRFVDVIAIDRSGRIIG